MNIGRCRRAFDRALDEPSPMIGNLAGGAGNDDVELGQTLGPSSRRMPEAPKRSANARPRSIVRLAMTICFRMTRGEMRRAQLDHLAGADEQHLLSACARRCVGETHRRGRHRDDVGADRRRRAHVLWPPQNELWNSLFSVVPARRIRARCAPLSSARGSAVRRAPLNRARWRRGTHGARHRGQDGRRYRVRSRGPEHGDNPPASRSRPAASASTVELGAVAGRQDRRLMHMPAAHQIGAHGAQLFGMKRQLLAHLKRRRAVVYAESE